jgi:flavin-dependent dehydrogenase
VQCAEFIPTMLDQELRRLEGVTAQPINRMTTVVETDTPDRKPDFLGRMIDRESFDRMLARRAAEAGVECHSGVAVTGVDADGTVTTGDGQRYRGRVLIGADGPRSAAGRAVGSVNTEIVETRQITVPLLTPHTATDIFLRADIVGGYGWLFPKGDKANLGLGVVPAHKDKLKPLLETLHRQMIDAGRVGREILGHTGGAIPVGGRITSFGRLGDCAVLLAGDAAGLTNPVTGAGIPAAVQSGALAGRAAASYLAGDDDAVSDYDEDLADLFDVSLGRALRRRRELLSCYDHGAKPDTAALRRGWIAYDEYWAA